MPIVMPDPNPEPWCTLDGEAMPYSEWERRIGDQEARMTTDRARELQEAIDSAADSPANLGDSELDS